MFTSLSIELWEVTGSPALREGLKIPIMCMSVLCKIMKQRQISNTGLVLALSSNEEIHFFIKQYKQASLLHLLHFINKPNNANF